MVPFRCLRRVSESAGAFSLFAKVVASSLVSQVQVSVFLHLFETSTWTEGSLGTSERRVTCEGATGGVATVASEGPGRLDFDEL